MLVSCLLPAGVVFLSTPSARRATRRSSGRWSYDGLISIHALREEGDYFKGEVILRHVEFLSTPSARRATRSCSRSPGTRRISIHALREEGD